MEREELGSLFGRITRRLIAAEGPLLDGHGLSMWGYSVLSQLARQPGINQLTLATAIGYDKSRLIALLDVLERDGLIVREPDPADRRNRQVRLTAAGQARHTAVQADIRAMEDDLLGELTAAERRSLISMLGRLANG
ncbi:MarR family winged helix-turn-helix transcriptional regulator [Kribbella sp. VKM Ac-2568]|uniref:MarR family winged helix-turn-helix transcriptional regulator n=1 Tax=Kribbella sp. VKM Ac-2568 TaxID=2512219 RepID=UPI00104BE8E7|nr:MarR family transcriptional regulator [Kribbella sp. VKM Ac-2568]TCM45791.1 DNA-binding MarR family transcriptional regulator [Kribbella sp. VKM Ac-2568]